MIEKVSPKHPDKIADRIAGALVDLAYTKESDPRIAVEVLIGHSCCHIIAETSVHLPQYEVSPIVHRIAGPDVYTIYDEYRQDVHLAENQKGRIRCGDNGIFKGIPITEEMREISSLARKLNYYFSSDGKYIIDRLTDEVIICQSNATEKRIKELCPNYLNAKINPLGYWTGGTNVDTGATNRKLGSDMGDAITGGGLHGKDLSKADVSANIYCRLQAEELGKVVTALCAIGDENLTVIIDGVVSLVPYEDVVEVARKYINMLGGFEKLAEWGLY